MITPADILNAGNRVLKENFPDIPRESHDISEGFTRECFFAELDGLTTSFQSETVTDESVILRINYFPKSSYINIADLHSMEAKIRTAFGNVLKVTDDFYIPTGDITYETTSDGVLTADIELDFMQQLPEDEDLEDIDTLFYNN